MEKSYKNELFMPCLFRDIPVATSLTTAPDPACPKRATAGDIRRSSHGASQSVQHQITIKHWTASCISRVTLIDSALASPFMKTVVEMDIYAMAG
ncbi:hypothetical protein K439DRAFT_696241 [Ramaria rubella]|nr:hypothetical protein K439DRAFT_696241 [Ramaria rubella]